MMERQVPLVSIITVCYNALATLPATAESLFSQTSQNYEWIVVDGASTDGSLAWLEENCGRMSSFVSERDNGIYDAMNKAVKLARGAWVFFLNADDRFADREVLADIARELQSAVKGEGIVFGDAIYTDGTREWPRAFHWVTGRNLVYGDLCHQVIFARRELFSTVGGFDTTLRINADFEWLLRVVKHGFSLRHVKRNVAYFYKGGAHVKAAVASEIERFTVRHRYCNPLAWRLGNFRLRVELKLRRLRGEAV